MCDHLSLEVEEILAKSKKFLQDIRQNLSSRGHYCTSSAFDSLHSMRSINTFPETPPIWDKELMAMYTKRLVESFIYEAPNQNTAKEEKINKKDESIMVKDCDFENIDKENIEVVCCNENDSDKCTQELKVEWKPIKKHLIPTKKVKMKNITPRSTKTTRLRAELCRQNFLQPEKEQEKKKILLLRRNNEKKNSEQNPDTNSVNESSILESTKTEETKSHPSDDNGHYFSSCEDKLKNTNTIEPKEIFLNSKQVDKIKESDHVDSKKSSTWHDVLSEEKVKRRIYKTSLQKHIKHFLQMKNSETNANEMKEENDFDLSIEKLNPSKKFINLGNSELKIKEESEKTFGKLTIKNLPILYIRGDCQIQKSVSVNIDPQTVNEIDSNNQHNLKNTKFEKIIHNAEKTEEVVQKNKCTELNSTKVELNTNVEKIVTEKEDQNKVPIESSTIRSKENRYLSPFINSKTEPYYLKKSHQRASSSDSYETLPCTSISKLSSTDSKETLTSSSSQTDDQKLKSKKNIKIKNEDVRENSTAILNLVEDAMFSIIKNFEEISDLSLPLSESETNLCQINKPRTEEVGNISPQKSELLNLSNNQKTVENKPSNSHIAETQTIRSENEHVDAVIKGDIDAAYSNGNFIDKIFKKICLDEPEGLKYFKNNKQKINEALTTEKLDNLKKSPQVVSLCGEKEYRNIDKSNKAHTVSVGCNTEQILLSELSPTKQKYISSERKDLSEFHYQSSPTSTISNDSVKHLFSSSFNSPKLINSQKLVSSASLENCDLCSSSNKMEKDFEFSRYRKCNVISLNSLDPNCCSRRKFSKQDNKKKQCYSKKEQVFDNLHKDKLKGSKKVSKHTFSNTDTTKPKMFENFNDNSNMSTTLDSISSCQGYFHNIKHRKLYDSEVKRAVKQFLNSLDTQLKPKTHKKENIHFDAELKLSDILLTSTPSSFSTLSSTNSGNKNSICDNKKEKNVTNFNPLNLQRDFRFIIEDKNKEKSTNKLRKNTTDSELKTFADLIDNQEIVNENSEIGNTFRIPTDSTDLNKYSSSSSSDSSLFVSYTKLKKIKSCHNNPKQTKIEDKDDKENLSEGEVVSLGEI